jgi:hypothetical protein
MSVIRFEGKRILTRSRRIGKVDVKVDLKGMSTRVEAGLNQLRLG